MSELDLKEKPVDSLSVSNGFPTGSMLVEQIDGQDILMRREDGSLQRSVRAFSCLAQPEPGDTVLTAENGGKTYVLAILERPSSEEQVPLSLTSETAIRVKAPRFSFETPVFEVAAGAISLVAGLFNSLFKESNRIAGTDRSSSASATQTTGSRLTVVHQSDVQKAAELSQTIDGGMVIQSKTAILNTQSDLRLNGERVNVG
ncbi:DUF3540 domain-containing protein [Roseibium sp. MMSF_3544]|uniref:DUF3540 domain-containing protein n=1 Tax=unclassified Roseibium TaxID=2629323 RepID=UPI00273E5991|nr:DUF3540 domain-containing protein [Roseibium sp. MMSF_3544]